jgi:hypothetical protein
LSTLLLQEVAAEAQLLAVAAAVAVTELMPVLLAAELFLSLI